MYALVNPDVTNLKYISFWAAPIPPAVWRYDPTYSPLPNAARVTDVDQNPFPAGEPCFWVECPDNANNNDWYYNTATQTVELIPNVPNPYPYPDSLKNHP